MATDYDDLRTDVKESQEQSLETLRGSGKKDARSVDRELDEVDASEGFELPDVDLPDLELIINIIPQREDEFTCFTCFLVRHRSQLAVQTAGYAYCTDCRG